MLMKLLRARHSWLISSLRGSIGPVESMAVQRVRARPAGACARVRTRVEIAGPRLRYSPKCY